MKKQIFAIAMIAAVSLVSCNKSEKNPAPNGGTVSGTKSTSRIGGWGLNNWWIDWMQMCVIKPVDCYDVIIVKPHVTQAFPLLDGAIASGGTAVSSFFNSQSDPDFIDLWEPSDLAGLKAGSLHISGTQNNGMHYYFVGASAQVSSTNHDHVYQFQF